MLWTANPAYTNDSHVTERCTVTYPMHCSLTTYFQLPKFWPKPTCDVHNAYKNFVTLFRIPPNLYYSFQRQIFLWSTLGRQHVYPIAEVTSQFNTRWHHRKVMSLDVAKEKSLLHFYRQELENVCRKDDVWVKQMKVIMESTNCRRFINETHH